MQKNGYTFATVYSNKCVSVFLHQTIVDPCLQNSTSDVTLIELSVDYKKKLHYNLRLQKCFVLLVVGDSKTKVGSAEEPRLAPLVPSICWTIFAKRLWRFWAQELENV